ncbi:MAG: threonylcarbamoyl-AMP synthase, partial [Methanosarcinales archaeon]|nr:threonylcarbamoyl-AMP synthase [Methanosarcinales archaeon]
RNLFKGMRFLDEKKLDLIIVDGSNCYESIGVAIHNRLKKAADECIQVF